MQVVLGNACRFKCVVECVVVDGQELVKVPVTGVTSRTCRDITTNNTFISVNVRVLL